MKGYYIEITNNLLEAKHRKRMGTAVWEFMWCLDKITKVDTEGLGWIYGGRPINLREIKEEIGITEPKISKNLNKLMREGYLILLRTPRGLVIKVCKAKKRFAQKVKSDLTKRENHTTLKGKSNIRQDNRQDNSMSSKPTDWNLEKEVKKILTDPKRHIQVIGVWIKETELKPENSEQIQSIIKRNLRPAKLLNGYKNEDIKETIKVLKNTDYLKKFTLETVAKYIDEVISKKKKEGPKIIRFEQIRKDGRVVMRPIYAK